MKKKQLLSIPGFGLLAAFMYCIPLFFFIKSDRFESIWMLYLGNILLGLAVALFMLFHIQKRKNGSSTISMVTAGLMTTGVGIILSGIIAFLLLMILVPHFGGSATQQTLPAEKMVQEIDHNRSNLTLTIYMNLIIGNIAAGSFASVILAYAAKYNQTKDEESVLLKEETRKL
jgi:predicted ABC-type exoprotein transport system permease subunit